MVSPASSSRAVACCSIHSSPLLGVSSNPIRLSRVLLPEPDGPTSAVISPWRSCKQTSCSTCTALDVPGAKILLTPRSCNTTSDIANRLGRIVARRPSGRQRSRQHATANGNKQRRYCYLRQHDNFEQARAGTVEQIHQAIAAGHAKQRTNCAQQRTLGQKH